MSSCCRSRSQVSQLRWAIVDVGYVVDTLKPVISLAMGGKGFNRLKPVVFHMGDASDLSKSDTPHPNPAFKVLNSQLMEEPSSTAQAIDTPLAALAAVALVAVLGLLARRQAAVAAEQQRASEVDALV